VDATYAIGVSATWNDSLWSNNSNLALLQPFCAVQVCSPVLLHCSIMMHINMHFEIYFKVSANYRKWKFSKNTFLSVNTGLCCNVESTGCCHLHTDCTLYDRTADSIPTCGLTILSQQILNEIISTHGIIARWTRIEQPRAGWRSVNIHISGGPAINSGGLSTLRKIRSGRCHARSGWCSSYQRCTYAIRPPIRWLILCSTIGTTETSVCVILTNHWWLSFNPGAYWNIIGNNPILNLKLPGGPKGFDGSCGTSFPLSRNKRHPAHKPQVTLHSSLAVAIIPCLSFLRRITLCITLRAPA